MVRKGSLRLLTARGSRNPASLPLCFPTGGTGFAYPWTLPFHSSVRRIVYSGSEVWKGFLRLRGRGGVSREVGETRKAEGAPPNLGWQLTDGSLWGESRRPRGSGPSPWIRLHRV